MALLLILLKDKSYSFNLNKNIQTLIELIITNIAIASVEINPPIKPSNVFFGDNSINYVLPKSLPKIYAKISLVITSIAGIIIQIIPSYRLIIIEET